MGVLQGNGGIPPRTGIDDRLPPSSSSNPPPPGGGGGGGSSSVTPDQEKTKLIQQQLVLLLHAHKCLQRERESESYRCSLPHCQVMKEVFRHIMQCTKTRDCSCKGFCMQHTVTALCDHWPSTLEDLIVYSNVGVPQVMNKSILWMFVVVVMIT